jgi:signal transduction histidine kinase
MGVRSDWPILAGILQKGLDAIPAPERDAIYRDWIAIRYQHSVDYSLLWKLGVGAALVLLVVFAERTHRLNRANARLRRLGRELSLVEERERRRLAGELHDSPMQKLALAQMQFGSASRGAEPKTAERMTTGLGLMREAIGELRTLQFELSPPMLYQEGLAPTLRWLATNATERSGVAFSYLGAADAPPLPQELAIVLFQCARELVYNVAKHSSALHATIELGLRDGRVVLVVADDGKGYPPEGAVRERTKAGGFGLFGIRERLALFGGDLVIVSDATGTRASVRMPLSPAASGRVDEKAAAPAATEGRAADAPRAATS